MDTSKFERLEEEKKRLESLRRYEPLVPDTDEELNRLVKIAAFVCDAPISLVNLVEANQTIFKAAIGTNLKGSPREISFCSKAIQGSGILEVTDAREDPRFKGNPLVTGDTHIQFYAGTPLVNKEGAKMGTLCVFDLKPKSLSAEQKEALETLGRMAMLVIETKKQTAVLKKANLPLVLTLESKIKTLEKALTACKPFAPAGVFQEMETPTAGSAPVLETKEMVTVHFRLHQFANALEKETAAAAFGLLKKLYETVETVISTFHGRVHRYNGESILACFSEPLASYPFEENALYGSFDLLNRFLPHIDAFNELHKLNTSLTIALHGGIVTMGTVALPHAIEPVLAGTVLQWSEAMSQSKPMQAQHVLLSQSFLEKVKNLVAVRNMLSVGTGGNTAQVYEVSLKS